MNAYTLFSGSSGNCILLCEGNTRILVDAGCSMKRISAALSCLDLSPSDLSGVIITHEHIDHTKALPQLTKHLSVPVYCQEAVAKELYLSLLEKDSAAASSLAACIRTVETGMEYELGSIVFTPFRTPHDSVDSQGFIIGDRVLGIATDLGHVSGEVRAYLSGCKTVILESNHDLKMLYDGPYPPYLKERVAGERGHLNNEACASFATHLVQMGCESLTLFHLSRDNNTPELALGETERALSELGARRGTDYTLQIAGRCEVTKVL
ncbi:MAG: MBL fold metallo-hydrolase [Clostridia bacterium]|nr:MBL fold metallo-hydrolase [Clostridia bacterium]